MIREIAVVREHHREINTQGIEAMFEIVVRHIFDHRHRALSPLAHSAQAGMVELGLVAASFCKGLKEDEGCIMIDVLAGRRPIDRGHTFYVQVSHHPAPLLR